MYPNKQERKSGKVKKKKKNDQVSPEVKEKTKTKERMKFVWTHLDIREEHLQHIGAWVAGVEEHELGFLQMIGGETLLDLKRPTVKDFIKLEGRWRAYETKRLSRYDHLEDVLYNFPFNTRLLEGAPEDKAPRQNHLLVISIVRIRCDSVTVNKMLASIAADAFT